MPLIIPTLPFFTTTLLAGDSGTALKAVVKTVNAAKRGFKRNFEVRAENI
jgi:hypothetical protein